MTRLVMLEPANTPPGLRMWQAMMHGEVAVLLNQQQAVWFMTGTTPVDGVDEHGRLCTERTVECRLTSQPQTLAYIVMPSLVWAVMPPRHIGVGDECKLTLQQGVKP